MDRIWLSAPAPAMKVWRELGVACWLTNSALAHLGAERGMDDAQWRALAHELLTLCGEAAEPMTLPDVSIGGHAHRPAPVVLGPGWLVWFESMPAYHPPRGADGLKDAQLSRDGAFDSGLATWITLAGLWVWRLDLVSKRIQFNSVGYEAVGIAPRAEGLDIDEFRRTIHPDDLPAVITAAREAEDSERIVDVITRYRTPHGGYRHWVTRRVTERDAQGRAVAIAGVAIDQSDRIAERERARVLAQRIAFITQAAGAGMWRVDLHSGVFEWSEQMHRIYGVPLEQGPPLLETLINEIVHPEDRDAVRRRRDRANAHGDGLAPLDFRICRPDGSVRWLSSWSHRAVIDGRIVDSGITVDVTEHHLVAAQLREANARALLAAESAGIGTWERDFVRGESVWNAQMYRLRGLDPQSGATPEVLRTQARHPDDGEAMEARMRRAVEAGTELEDEFRVVWPDGTVHWLASRAMPQRGPSGKVERLLGVNWDITERKRIEEALRDKAAAEKASRAKSEFLSRMSHELRTPLNAVLGFTQLLTQDAHEGLSPRQAERVGRVHSAGLHLLALIDDVLDLASIESSGLSLVSEAVSLQAAIDDAIQWTQPQAARAGITMHAESVTGWVHADGRRLRQIISNLLSNAIKYNRPHGEVRVRAQPCMLEGKRAWQLQVRDTGRGMTPEQRDHLYEPFNRLGAERHGIQGTGIGLAIVRQLLTQMHGSIEVQSTPGQGSEFRVTLPCAMAQPGVAAPAVAAALPARSVEPTPDAPPPPGLRVLYIEDNPVNVLLVQELVAMRDNVRLITAENGAGGVALAGAERPHVVLIDMQLPDFDGFEVLRRVRAQQPDAGPVCIAVSANAMSEDVSSARAAGFDDYWTKPLACDQFLARLDALAASGQDQGASRSRTQAPLSRR